MTASLDTLVIAAYVFADALVIPRSGPPGKITDVELIALSVAQAVIGVPSDRQFLGLVERLLPGWFPHLPDQSQYNRRLRRLTPWITTTQLSVAELVATGQVRLVDGTLLSCANYAGCALAEPVRRGRRVRLLPVQKPMVLGHATGLDERPKRRPDGV
jgi:hypothetical protein